MKKIINKFAFCVLTFSCISCYGAHNSCALEKNTKSIRSEEQSKSQPGTPRSTSGAGYSSSSSPSHKVHSSRKKHSPKNSHSGNNSVASSPRVAASGSLSSLKGAPQLQQAQKYKEEEKKAAAEKEKLSNAAHYARIFFNKLKDAEIVTEETIKQAQEYVSNKTGIAASSKSLWLHAAQWKRNNHAFKLQQLNTAVDDLINAAKEYEERAQKTQPDGVDVPLEV